MSALALTQWLDTARARSAFCVVEGPVGIGKTHLIASLIAHADGWRVLRAQPAQADMRLVGSALLDLCDGVTDDEIDRLPRVQASALRKALLRGEAAGDTSPHTVAVAFTSLLRTLCEITPLLICVDNIHWLDIETSNILSFAVRRLPPAGIAVVFGLRTGADATEPAVISDVADALPPTRIAVAPLSSLALDAVLTARLPRAVPHWVTRRSVEVAAGNPLFALEVARSLLAREHRGLDSEHIRVPPSLAEVVGEHVSSLSSQVQDLLAAAAALRKPSVRELRELGVHACIADAEQAGLISVQGHEVMFEHPLYAAAAYDALTSDARSALHTRLAKVVTGDEERARHLALGAAEPDETVAVALDVARVRALQRGALHAAIDACRLALRVTPDPSKALPERMVELGRLLYRSGDATQAREQLAAAVDCADDAQVRARALLELARVVADTESTFEAARIEMEALELAGDDVDLVADIHIGLALANASDWQTALEHSRIAVRLMEDQPDTRPDRLAAALVAYVVPSFYTGNGADFDRCLQAVELEAAGSDLPVAERGVSILAFLHMWCDNFAEAREQLANAYQLAVDHEDEAGRAYVLSNMSRVEVRAGNWDLAQLHINQCRDVYRRNGNQYSAGIADQQQFWLDVYRGKYSAALDAAAADIEAGRARDNPLLEGRGRAIRGFWLLVQGDAAAAAEEFDKQRETFVRTGAIEPSLRLVGGEHVEALVLAGRLDDAQAVLDDLVSIATRVGRSSVLASAARAGALLHAARGDFDAALAAADRSIGLYNTLERRFDRARALLTRGSIHRRAKHKSAAASDLDTALSELEALGALDFAAQARAEIARIGMRRVERTTDLTETELRVAELSARGMTAAEVAGQLFISPKTVSANLTNIYRKLGVRNRAGLIARFTADTSPD